APEQAQVLPLPDPPADPAVGHRSPPPRGGEAAGGRGAAARAGPVSARPCLDTTLTGAPDALPCIIGVKWPLSRQPQRRMCTTRRLVPLIGPSGRRTERNRPT